jgi:hypothetical protein
LGIAELGLEQDMTQRKKKRERGREDFSLQKRKHREEEYVLRDQAL